MKIPKTIKKTLYVTMETRGAGRGELSIMDFDRSDYETEYSRSVLVCTTEIEVQLPQDFDISEPMIASLEKARESIVQEFTLKLARVDQELAEVRALPSP